MQRLTFITSIVSEKMAMLKFLPRQMTSWLTFFMPVKKRTPKTKHPHPFSLPLYVHWRLRDADWCAQPDLTRWHWWAVEWCTLRTEQHCWLLPREVVSASFCHGRWHLLGDAATSPLCPTPNMNRHRQLSDIFSMKNFNLLAGIRVSTYNYSLTSHWDVLTKNAQLMFQKQVKHFCDSTVNTYCWWTCNWTVQTLWKKRLLLTTCSLIQHISYNYSERAGSLTVLCRIF